MIRIYSDAGTFKNRICVYDERTKRFIIDKIHGHKLTNNYLEYKALQRALKYSNDEYRSEKIQIFTDSKLVVNQVVGSWVTNNQDLFEEMFRCRDLMTPDIKILWCPREKNLAGHVLEKLYHDERTN